MSDIEPPPRLSIPLMYSDGSWQGRIIQPEVDAFYDSLIFNEILPRNPHLWGGKRIVDISANDGLTDIELLSRISDAISATTGQKQIEPIVFIPLDGSYELGSVLLSKAKENLHQSKTKLNKTIVINEPKQVDARNITLNDIGEKPADLIVDRLGALWHELENGDTDGFFNLLQRLSGLLTENGSIVVDAYTKARSSKAAMRSTFTNLYKFSGLSPEQINQRLGQIGLRVRIANPSLGKNLNRPSNNPVEATKFSIGRLLVFEKKLS